MHLVCGIIFYKFRLSEPQTLTWLTFIQVQNWGLRNRIMFHLCKNPNKTKQSDFDIYGNKAFNAFS